MPSKRTLRNPMFNVRSSAAQRKLAKLAGDAGIDVQSVDAVKAKPRKDEEHQHQVALFRWAELQAANEPLLNMLFAVPNGSNKSKAQAGRFKAEGLKAGVPDVLLPVARGNYAGLAIEMKSSTGRLESDQADWRDKLEAEGWSWHLIRDWTVARDVIVEYLKKPRPPHIGADIGQS